MAAPLNILELRDTYEIGGPGKTILETAKAIDGAKFRTHLGVFRTVAEPADSPFLSAARAIDLPVHAIEGRSRYDPALIWRVADVIRRFDIGVVHAHEVKSDVIGVLAARLCGVKMMTTLHGWIGNSSRQRKLIAIDKRVVRRFDRVIAVSRAIYDEMTQAGMAPTTLRLLHNGIVLDRYRRTGQRGVVDQLAGHPVRGPIISSVGRLSAEKGHLDLVEALALVRARGAFASLVLVGDGPERAALERRVEELGLGGSVVFAGYYDQPARVVEESNLVVLPSHTEGLPNAALEALAMEVPVLATCVGGTPEVIVDGETGRLVPARHPGAMAGALMEFLTDPAPWREMAMRGRTMVETQFDFGLRTRRLEAIYDELSGAQPS